MTYLLLLCIFRLLIGYTEDKDDIFGEWKKWKGYAYAGGMFITAVIQSLALHQYFHKMMTIGMRMRTGIMGLVYEKVIMIRAVLEERCRMSQAIKFCFWATGKTYFFHISWAPRISWLGAFGLLVIFLRLQPRY